MNVLNIWRKQKEQTRGAHAERVMNDPVVKDALDKIEETITRRWRDETDEKIRESLWYTLQGQITFREYMTAVIATGKASGKELANFHKQRG